jgi:hypothetical protein
MLDGSGRLPQEHGSGRNNGEISGRKDRRSRSHKLSAKHPGFLRSSVVAQLVRSVAPFLHRCSPLRHPEPSRQYGADGKMQGKKFMICATWNAPREVFDNPNGVLYAGKGTADL